MDYAQQAKRRNILFNLTQEESYQLFTSSCHYCGAQPANIKKHGRNKQISFAYQGIDRVDPNKGYTHDNVLPACRHCNYAKREMTYLEFIS